MRVDSQIDVNVAKLYDGLAKKKSDALRGLIKWVFLRHGQELE